VQPGCRDILRRRGVEYPRVFRLFRTSVGINWYVSSYVLLHQPDAHPPCETQQLAKLACTTARLRRRRQKEGLSETRLSSDLRAMPKLSRRASMSATSCGAWCARYRTSSSDVRRRTRRTRIRYRQSTRSLRADRSSPRHASASAAPSRSAPHFARPRLVAPVEARRGLAGHVRAEGGGDLLRGDAEHDFQQPRSGRDLDV
jgi:hypothetical protein